jgi:hypothetical protein
MTITVSVSAECDRCGNEESDQDTKPDLDSFNMELLMPVGWETVYDNKGKSELLCEGCLEQWEEQEDA